MLWQECRRESWFRRSKCIQRPSGQLKPLDLCASILEVILCDHHMVRVYSTARARTAFRPKQ
jgi:hypothetical protein